MKKAMKGFSLIEIMIVIAIIAIIAGIAYPSYTEYVRQARRSEGISMLLEIMAQQERYFTEQLTYEQDLTNLGYSADPMLSEGGHYSIAADLCTGSLPITRCVNLTATPQGVQAADGDITLDSRGLKTPAEYWQ